jgi:excisionase family DNA binding protein
MSLDDLAALLADPARAADLAEPDVRDALRLTCAREAALGAEQAALAVVRSVLAARLAADGGHRPPAPPSEAGPLTQEEAAEHYRLPLRTVRFLTRTKRVPSYLAGRNRMIRPADIDRYLARCRAQAVKVGTILDG